MTLQDTPDVNGVLRLLLLPTSQLVLVLVRQQLKENHLTEKTFASLHS